MRVAIVGTGAVGSLYGIKLGQSGWDVITIHRSDADVVSCHGIALKSPWGDVVFRPKQVCRSIDEIDGHLDYILVATKVLPSIDVVALIQSKVSKGTTIVLLQNGIHIETAIQAAFPNNTIIRGLAFVCVSKEAPGKIFHQDYGRLVIGKYPKGEDASVQILADAFNSVGVKCTTTDNVLEAVWKKLVWNAPFNPMSVIKGGWTTAQLLEDPETRTTITSVMQEVCTLANVDGCPLPESVVERNISDTESMTPYKTSMLLDYEAGRALETEAILGNAVRFADEKNMPVPRLKALYASLLTIKS